MVTCSKCIWQANDDAKFCPKCGQAIEKSVIPVEIKEEQDKSKVCLGCGYTINNEVKFCPKCGVIIAQEIRLPVGAEALGEQKREGKQKEEPKGGCFQTLQTVFLVICLLIWGLNYTDIGSSWIRSAKSVFSSSEYTLKANQLAEEYNLNSVKADKKYKGKMVTVTGKVAYKGQFNNSHELYVCIFDSGDTHILVGFSLSEKKGVNGLKIGDFVEIKGECAGLVTQENKNVKSIQLYEAKLK